MSFQLQGLQRATVPVALAASLLFLFDLFLGWQRVAVHVAGAVDIENTTSGWSGWGALAGVFALGLIAVELVRLRAPQSTLRTAYTAAMLAIGVLLTAALAVFTGEASVSIGAGSVGVQVDTTLWPAWAGLVLAGAAATAALVSLVAELTVPGPRGVAPQAGA